MKTILIITLALVSVTLMSSGFLSKPTEIKANTEISFHTGTFSEALEIARNQNKPVFLDISTAWCGYCKRMKANVYTDSNVAGFFNTTFINVVVDAEKGEGIEIAKKYGAKGYPTFVFINPDGSISKQTSGYRNPEKFLALAKELIKDDVR
jgi:thiol:disulfide interchange protein